MTNDTFMELYFDGSCKGLANNRKIGMGVHIQVYDDDGNGHIFEEKAWTDNDDYITEHKTNNVAEYKALLYGLYILKDEKNINLHVMGDSKLVINQVFGDWKVNMPHLKSLNDACKIVLRTMTPNIKASWIPRKDNLIADNLAQRGANNDKYSYKHTSRFPSEYSIQEKKV